MRGAEGPTVKRTLRVFGEAPDIIVSVPVGADEAAFVDAAMQEQGDSCYLVPTEQILEELRARLRDAAYLMSTGKESHRVRGEKLRAEALDKAKALDLDTMDLERSS